MSINTATLLGRVGRDPEVRTVGQNNSKVAQFSLCTGGKYKTQDGREVDDTAWHSIVAWRNLAEIAEKYIKKGSQILVIGHLSYREYIDNNGNKRSVTEIVADTIQLLGKKENGDSASAPCSTAGTARVQTTPLPTAGEDDDTDLPF